MCVCETDRGRLTAMGLHVRTLYCVCARQLEKSRAK